MGRIVSRRCLVAGVAPVALGRFAQSPVTEAACRRVEIQPGYPGFEGYVAGIAGGAATSCLSDLMDTDPAFDISEQDQLNQEAANVLGIRGGPRRWVWENWAAIEERRELPLTPYASLLLREPPIRHPSAPDDLRILAGEFNTDWAVMGVIGQLGKGALPALRVFPTDYHLRSYTFLAIDSGRLNARQLVETYPLVVEGFFTGGWNGFYDSSAIRQRLVARGGYVPVSSVTSVDIQLFTLHMGLIAYLTVHVPSMIHATILNHLTVFRTRWYGLRQTGSTVGYADFLAQEGFWEKFGFDS